MDIRTFYQLLCCLQDELDVLGDLMQLVVSLYTAELACCSQRVLLRPASCIWDAHGVVTSVLTLCVCQHMRVFVCSGSRSL